MGVTYEVVSLGCNCGPANYFRSVGLRKFAYPFCWSRMNSRQVSSCIASDFKGLFSREVGVTCMETGYNTSHRRRSIVAPEVIKTVRRRVERFRGLRGRRDVAFVQYRYYWERERLQIAVKNHHTLRAVLRAYGMSGLLFTAVQSMRRDAGDEIIAMPNDPVTDCWAGTLTDWDRLLSIIANRMGVHLS